MILDAHWDSVLIVDSSLPEEVLSQIESAIKANKKFEKGIVGGGDPEKTNYHWSTDSSFKFVEDWLIDSGLIPILQNHDIEITSRHHQRMEGGKMTWHCDGTYSIAATVYLSSCEGGELEVKSPCRTKSILIKPSINRIVVIKCDNEHRVLPVKEGVRDTIQVFFTFIERNEE